MGEMILIREEQTRQDLSSSYRTRAQLSPALIHRPHTQEHQQPGNSRSIPNRTYYARPIQIYCKVSILIN